MEYERSMPRKTAESPEFYIYWVCLQRITPLSNQTCFFNSRPFRIFAEFVLLAAILFSRTKAKKGGPLDHMGGSWRSGAGIQYLPLIMTPFTVTIAIAIAKQPWRTHIWHIPLFPVRMGCAGSVLGFTPPFPQVSAHLVLGVGYGLWLNAVIPSAASTGG
jgi:hypothetical protein